MFLITEMYQVFLRHWREYALDGRRVRASWAGGADALGRRFARALDALERNRGGRFPEFQDRVIGLMNEMQAFMGEHPLIAARRPALRPGRPSGGGPRPGEDR